MRRKNNALSFAIGSLIGTVLAVCAASQQGNCTETHIINTKLVAEPLVFEAQEEPIHETVHEETLEETEIVSLGEFKLTAYCACEKCCGEWAINRPVDEAGNPVVVGCCGEVLVEGISIAVDKNVIPYGAEVIVNDCTYKAQDCGGAIKGNRIDVYFVSHEDALEFGVQYAEVFMKKGV